LIPFNTSQWSLGSVLMVKVVPYHHLAETSLKVQSLSDSCGSRDWSTDKVTDLALIKIETSTPIPVGTIFFEDLQNSGRNRANGVPP
jgi:hypothetical protein